MLSKFWVLWLPLFAVIVTYVLEHVLNTGQIHFMYSEQGFYENLQFAVLVFAFLVAVSTLIRMDRKFDPLMTAWVVLASLCCVYVGGEEISWGQQYLQWNTPEYWAAINDQNETNYHNTSSWFDQKPRLVLMIGIGVGGLIVPWLKRNSPAALPKRFTAFYPQPNMWFLAGLVIGVHLLDKVVEAFGGNLFERTSEQQELYMYYFVLLYLISLRRTLPTKTKTPA